MEDSKQGSTALTQDQRTRAAGLVRRVVGAQALDALLGAQSPADSATKLLANRPELSAESVQDGLDLLEARRQDHPGGLPAQIWGRRVHTARNGVAIAFAVALVIMVALLLLAPDGGAGDGPFAWIGGTVGEAALNVLVTAVVVLLVVQLILVWISVQWPAMIATGEARHAVRWALDRPGQLERGLPVAEPFTPARGLRLLTLSLAWVFAALCVTFALAMLVEGSVAHFLIGGAVAVAACLLAVGFTAGYRALGRAATVAHESLLLLRDDLLGLRVDAATAGARRHLVVSESGLGVFSVEERTVFPLTVALPLQEREQRHEDAVLTLGQEFELIGGPEVVPFVLRQRPHEEDGSVNRWQRTYAGGSAVATGRHWRTGRRAWIVVRDNPAAFSQDVLPLFDDRHGLMPDSVSVQEPEQVPADQFWIRDWVRARADDAG